MSLEKDLYKQVRQEGLNRSHVSKVKFSIAKEQALMKTLGGTEAFNYILENNPESEVEEILEDPKDYSAILSKLLGPEDISVYEEGSNEGKISKLIERNFYNDLLKYLRSVNLEDYMYIQSRRVANFIQEMENKGATPSETEEKLRKFNLSLNIVESLLKDFEYKNPEVFYGIGLRRLKKYLKNYLEGDGIKGRITETPYVEKQILDVQAAIIDGRPIFIHGHLGSGKTEMAIRASHKYLKEYKTKEEIDAIVEDEYTDWLKNNPTVSDKEKEEVKKSIRESAFGPLIISGSKETTTSDFTGHRTLNIKVIEEEAKKLKGEKIYKEFEEWLESEEGKNSTPEQKILKREILVEVYLKQSGGTFSSFYLGPVYKAMKEGRPIIIDEADAIPHDTLILLNHIMTRKPGDIIPIQGDSGEKLKVKKGFCVILTGNFPKIDGGDLYVGRQDMDAAFLSRLIKLEHDYLPQSLDVGNKIEEKEDQELQKSELFHVLISGLINRYGIMKIPEGEEEKLFKLAAFARHIQDIFSGRHNKILSEEGNSMGAMELREKLHKEVLSMRQLLNILREWRNPVAFKGRNEGLMQYELDHYILKHFISTVPEEETKWELYKIAHEFGFFISNGWPEAEINLQTESRAGVVNKFDIESPKNKVGELRTLTAQEVVAICFGKGPEPDLSELDLKFEDGNTDVLPNIEEQINREKSLDELKKALEKMF